MAKLFQSEKMTNLKENWKMMSVGDKANAILGFALLACSAVTMAVLAYGFVAAAALGIAALF